MTFTATAKDSYTETEPDCSDIQAPIFTASISATGISLTVHNPNDFDVEFVAADTDEVLTEIEAKGTQIYSDYRELLNNESQSFCFYAYSEKTTYDYSFGYSSSGP